MTEFPEQVSLADTNPEYEEFLSKFKPKKTTDDCYTPDAVYDVVKEFAVERYGLQGREIIRPFWPGADYKRAEYPEGSVVIDNPPFSILSEIIVYYQSRHQPFFLFAPQLQIFHYLKEKFGGVTVLITDTRIIYKNGAKVITAFVTNMEPENAIVGSVELSKKIKAVTNNLRYDTSPTYKYPDNVLRMSNIATLVCYEEDITIKRKSGTDIKQMQHQREIGKVIFGRGYLLSTAATAEYVKARERAQKKADANIIEWELREEELELIKLLDEREKENE